MLRNYLERYIASNKIICVHLESSALDDVATIFIGNNSRTHTLPFENDELLVLLYRYLFTVYMHHKNIIQRVKKKGKKKI